MTTYCDTIQDRLAEEGAAALAADAPAAAHVAGCPGCAAVLDALARVDAALREVSRPDASDELATRALGLVREAAPGLHAVPPRSRLMAFMGGRLLTGVAKVAAVVLITGLLGVLVVPSYQQRSMSDMRSIGAPVEGVTSGRRGRGQATGYADGPARQEPVSVAAASPVARPRPNQPAARLDDRAAAAIPRLAEKSRDFAQAQAGSKQGESAASRFRESKLENERQAGKPAELDSLGYLAGANREKAQAELVAGLTRPSTLPPPSALPRPIGVEESLRRGKDGDRVSLGKVGDDEGHANQIASDKKRLKNKEDDPGPAAADPGPGPAQAGLAEKRFAAVAGGAIPADAGNYDANAKAPVSEILAERSTLTGLVFQEASGYWANTYVAGDAEMRFLEARLDQIQGMPRPERHARAYRQPFDRPEASALKVYLHADRRAMHGPTRMLVQVGIAAGERLGAARPPLNLGVVLDLRAGLDVERARAARALLVALAAGRRAGDRFSLTVAGRPGATVLGPDEFRHGRIQVAVDGLLGAADAAPTPATAVVTLDLPQAMETALTAVAGASDPAATIGASAVLLIASAPLGESAETLVRMAHASAVNGIPVAAVSLGGDADPDPLDRLVLAGQGERHLLAAAETAPDLAERVLLGVSRTVARAVRLRIRLAPGVKLVDVLGSCRLDQVAAAEVREAEKSVDVRLARALGIAADRGDDEEGIQIVIPAFHAGRDHVVLLDVVAERPGAIADVTVRYKDLVYLRNGVTSARLALANDEDVAGPLERNVTKNWLALRVSEQLRTAGGALASGDAAAAASALSQAQADIAALRARDAAFAADPELRADQALASEYLTLLADPSRFALLADSLQLAALHKLVPAFARAQGME